MHSGASSPANWAHLANQDLWLYIVQATWDDKQWLEAFCITWTTFLDVLEQLHSHLEQQNTIMQHPTHTQVAIALLKLAMPSSLWAAGLLCSHQA
ncbi:hypothetical protein Y1Q_0001052 [Alligator mississippiensis]|uniref:Uncharacterized protein n=1 Tax=Alligator mississippiensis TaxID=8496 RepID=A0A151NED8_ALLMI|nr:hypothetical protein Y1Q_0001052 [Alligator mississippiensis]